MSLRPGPWFGAMAQRAASASASFLLSHTLSACCVLSKPMCATTRRQTRFRRPFVIRTGRAVHQQRQHPVRVACCTWRHPWGAPASAPPGPTLRRAHYDCGNAEQHQLWDGAVFCPARTRCGRLASTSSRSEADSCLPLHPADASNNVGARRGRACTEERKLWGKRGARTPDPSVLFGIAHTVSTALRMRAHTPWARSLFHLHSRPARRLCVSVGRQGRAPNTGLGG